MKRILICTLLLFTFGCQVKVPSKVEVEDVTVTHEIELEGITEYFQKLCIDDFLPADATDEEIEDCTADLVQDFVAFSGFNNLGDTDESQD